MKMNHHLHSNQYSWASVRGPGHLLNGLPNQDACAVLSLKEGMAFIISDGVGSKKHADVGSRAVIQAVTMAIKTWRKFPQAPANHLLRLIHTYWELYVLPYERDDCATTCLFTFIAHDHRCVMGQVGDGVILFKLDGHSYVLHEKEDDYLNSTIPLHLARRTDWRIEDFYIEDTFELFMATDGVSEDLVVENRFEYMTHLFEVIQQVETQKKKNQQLKKILKQWKNPYNSDDKSLIIYSRKVMDET